MSKTQRFVAKTGLCAIAFATASLLFGSEAHAAHEGNSGDNIGDWKGFKGVRPMAGITFGGGPTLLGGNGGTQTTGGLLFGLKGGVLIDRWEIGGEFSPMTFSPALGAGGDPSLQLNAYGGYHIKLAGPISWPLRAGIGFAAVNIPSGALFEGRLDLIGISAMLGPVLLDLHAPSWRILANGDGYYMHFMFGVGGAILPDAF